MLLEVVVDLNESEKVQLESKVQATCRIIIILEAHSSMARESTTQNQHDDIVESNSYNILCDERESFPSRIRKLGVVAQLTTYIGLFIAGRSKK